MNHRDLIRAITDAAAGAGLSFEMDKTKGDHEKWRLDGMPIPIPRHREITPGVVQSIFKQAEAKLGKDWWK